MYFDAIPKIVAERTGCDISAVKPESKFSEIGIDSLDIVEFYHLGNDIATVWEGLKSGKKGIATITLLHTENLKQNLETKLKTLTTKFIWMPMIRFVPKNISKSLFGIQKTHYL